MTFLFGISSYEHPNGTHNEWSSQTAGSDAISISPAPTGTLYVAVYAFGLNCQYTITAHLYDASRESDVPIQLIDGIPQTGILQRGRMRYYHLSLYTQHADISFTVQRSVGDPDGKHLTIVNAVH